MATGNTDPDDALANLMTTILIDAAEDAARRWLTENILQCMLNGHDVVTFGITVGALTQHLGTTAMNILEDDEMDDHTKLVFVGAMLVAFDKVIDEVIVHEDVEE